MGSPLSQFIVYLHQRALADGRVPALTEHEIEVMDAIRKASDKTRTVAWLLVAGIGPQELGKLLNTNGSRKINRALAELARILEGRQHYAEANHGV